MNNLYDRLQKTVYQILDQFPLLEKADIKLLYDKDCNEYEFMIYDREIYNSKDFLIFILEIKEQLWKEDINNVFFTFGYKYMYETVLDIKSEIIYEYQIKDSILDNKFLCGGESIWKSETAIAA